MRKWPFTLFGFLIFLSCNKDIPPELQCDTSHPDKICREDAFRRGDFIGYLEYKYDSAGQLARKHYHSMQNQYMEEQFEYDSRKLVTRITKRDQHGNLNEEQQFLRTEFDSVASSVLFRNGNIVEQALFEYDANQRLRSKVTETEDAVEVREYLYQDDGSLYTEWIRDDDGNVIAYKRYKNYYNNILKVCEYDSLDHLTSMMVYVRDPDGRMLEIRYYNQDSKLSRQEVYTYQDDLLIRISTVLEGYETEFRIFHYP
ncbi:MAG TPA: hypothetical protein P5531_05180 [Bacteroidales bacterium]|nr:hypothetical protein [Bacteroidales bacterium]HSA42603.1 hypothetical protein [Bacteroidales bacterium]